jgi:hypothetical protein
MKDAAKAATRKSDESDRRLAEFLLDWSARSFAAVDKPCDGYFTLTACERIRTTTHLSTVYDNAYCRFEEVFLPPKPPWLHINRVMKKDFLLRILIVWRQLR